MCGTWTQASPLPLGGGSAKAEGCPPLASSPRHAELVSASMVQRAMHGIVASWTLKQVQGDGGLL
jgi:hypothetical protein